MYHTYDHEYKVYLDVYKNLKYFSSAYPNVEHLPNNTDAAIELIKRTIKDLNTINTNIVYGVLEGNDITKVTLNGVKLATTSGYHRYQEGITHIVYKISHLNDPDCITNLDIDLRFLKYGINFNWYSIKEMSKWKTDDYLMFDHCGKKITSVYRKAIDEYLRKHSYNSSSSITVIS